MPVAYFVFCLFHFGLYPVACWILVAQPGIEPWTPSSGLPAVEAWSPNHWTDREFPCCVFWIRSISCRESLPKILYSDRTSSIVKLRQSQSLRIKDKHIAWHKKKKPTISGNYHNYYRRKRRVSSCLRLREQLYFHIFLPRDLNCSGLFAFFLVCADINTLFKDC